MKPHSFYARTLSHTQVNNFASFALPLVESCASRVFPDAQAATSDCNFVVATTAKERDRVPALTPAEAAREMLQAARAGNRVALLLGNERHGLLNEEMMMAHRTVSIPTAGRDRRSLNLGQAACVIAYELFQQAAAGPEAYIANTDTGELASTQMRNRIREELLAAFRHVGIPAAPRAGEDPVEAERLQGHRAAVSVVT